ncbi:MAG TPA: sulfite oxidase [Gemmatimonadales bacterium]|nr:sulfite oxidase [Gemmatimonadales bacterium]
MPDPTTARRAAPGRIVRSAEPPNYELDLARLTTLLTPTDQFYVRCHGTVPDAAADWRLDVGGLVTRPLTLDLAALRALPQAECIATLECAGNRRTLQRPVPGGVQWQEGAVSTARWGGPRLADVLARAGLRPEALHIRLAGADRCASEGGDLAFARSVPRTLAEQDGALLALTMNGVPLPPLHGAPVRLVVPTRYGMDSVKWLRAITAAAEPEPGAFQTADYRLWYGDGGPGDELGPLRVASVIAMPRAGAPLRAGTVRIAGAAWTGTGTIASVEVSTDGGARWRSAHLLGAAVPGAWRLWESEWDARPGEHTLVARACDTAGNRQPDALPPNRKGYANNFVVPVTVGVGPA